MAEKKKRLAKKEREQLEKLGMSAAEDLEGLRKELMEAAPPWEQIAPEELRRIEDAGELMAARAESYYYGYMRAVSGSDVGTQAAGAIVGAVVGSTVGTVVGQIVGKKLDKTINIRDLVTSDITRRGGS